MKAHNFGVEHHRWRTAITLSVPPKQTQARELRVQGDSWWGKYTTD